MSRQPIVSLFAAAAFGAVMAATSVASGQAPQNAQNSVYNPRNCAAPTYYACMARCAPAGSTAEQQARCALECGNREDPMDCQFVRQSPTVATTNTDQRLSVRRR
jgi:hypothetical protein